MQDHAGYSSDEADQVYTRPGPNPSAQPSSLGPLQRANGSQLKSTAGDAARLVNQICTPGGLRAQPSREDLRIFVESVGSHSGQEVAELLEDKLVLIATCAVTMCLLKRLSISSVHPDVALVNSVSSVTAQALLYLPLVEMLLLSLQGRPSE